MKKLGTIAGAAALIAGIGLAGTALADIGFDQDVTPDAIFGSGNDNGAFTTDRQNNVEIGLRGKLRFNAVGDPENTFNSNGDGTYSFDNIVGPFQSSPTPEWQFEWTINTDEDGTNGQKINDLTYELGLDGNPGLATDFLTFDPIFVIDPIGGTNCADHAIGDNDTANGAGVSVDIADCRSGNAATKTAATAAYTELIDTKNVAQQSWRYNWFVAGFDPEDIGTYAIYLLAKDGNGDVVARSYIQILVGGATAAGPLLTCEGFEAPLDADVSVSKPNRLLPLRMALIDDSGIPLSGDATPPVVQVTFNSGTYEGEANLEDIDTAGKGDDGNMFVFDGSNWAFNMKTKGLAAGTYEITAVSGALEEYVIDPTCSVNVTIN